MHYPYEQEDDASKSESLEEVTDFIGNEPKETLTHRRTVRKRLEAKLERKRLREEIEDEFDEKFNRKKIKH